MLNNIQSQVMSYAAQAGAWIQSQIAVAQTSQYGIVRFLATNATPKTAIVSALGVTAAFCFAKALQNKVNSNSYLAHVPKLGEAITVINNTKNGPVVNTKPAKEDDIKHAKEARLLSASQNPSVKTHNKWAKGWAMAGVAFTAAAVAVAILMPTP